MAQGSIKAPAKQRCNRANNKRWLRVEKLKKLHLWTGNPDVPFRYSTR
jgi:hypothetical protein